MVVSTDTVMLLAGRGYGIDNALHVTWKACLVTGVLDNQNWLRQS